MVKDWLGDGRAEDVDCFRVGHGRGLDKATYGVNTLLPKRDHLADAESFAGEGVRLVRVKSLQVKAPPGDKCAMSKGVKLQQIRCRFLLDFDSVANADHLVGRTASLFRLRMEARQPRGIRFGRMPEDAPLTSWRSRGGLVRESEVRLWVAGQRVKIFLALFPSAVHLDSLPGSRSLLLWFHARRMALRK